MVPGVTAEDLVGALTRLDDGEITFHLVAEEEQRGIDVRHAGEVARVCCGEEGGAEGPVIEDDLVVVAADEIPHFIDIFAVAIRLEEAFGKVLCVILIVDRVGIQYAVLLCVLPGRQHGEDGRIQTAREKGTQRHVGNELPGGGVRDQVVGVPDGSLLVVGMLAGVKDPIGMVGKAFGGEHSVMAGQQFVDAFEDAAAGRSGGSEEEDCAETVLAQDGADIGVAEQGLELGAEDDAVLSAAIEERFHAEPVAAEGEAACIALPEGEGVDAVQAAEGVGAPLLEGVEEDLGIRVPLEVVAFGEEGLAEVFCVIQLSVIN